LSRFRKKIRAKNTKIRRKYTVPGDDGDEAIYGADNGDEAKIQVRPDDGARRWNLAM
jgi:hypothetical protein